MDGRLRAYSQSDGTVLWEVDTATDYQTVNGVATSGGSFGGGSGPVFKGRKLFVNSGYGIYFHMPGNVLRAFELPPEQAAAAGD